MEEDTSLVWRKAGKAGEGSNPANSADLLLLVRYGKNHNQPTPRAASQSFNANEFFDTVPRLPVLRSQHHKHFGHRCHITFRVDSLTHSKLGTPCLKIEVLNFACCAAFLGHLNGVQVKITEER